MKTKTSVKNIITSIIPSFVIMIIAFLKFKFFISAYGDELNGAVQLITQIYSYLTIAELGFGAATNIKLYKYFQENDEKKITMAFNESRSLYFKSGMFIFVTGIMISFILPFFINNNTVEPYYYICIMILYAIDFLVDYLYGLPYRNLLIVNEKIYIINIIKTTQQIVFKIIELILIINKVNLILVISLGVIANLISSYILIKITKKIYPYLSEYKEKDKTITKSVKDVFVNNITDIVNEKTDPIIIANQMGLKDTSIYSMYNLICNYIYMFILNFVSGIKGSLGAILNNKNRQDETNYLIFKQYLLVMNTIVLSCSITFALSASDFMRIYINKDYCFDFITVLLFSGILWINVMLKSLHAIVEVKGYFKEIKIPCLLQAISNIVLSLIFIKKLGITGVLLATFLTNIFITLPIKIKVGFGEFNKKTNFFILIIIYSIIVSSIIIILMNDFCLFDKINNLAIWFIYTAILYIVVLILIFISNYILFKEYRMLVKKIVNSKIIFGIKRKILYIYSSIIYKIKIKNKRIFVKSINDTLNEIIQNKASIIRFGDGEMDIINGKNLNFQNYDKELAKNLEKILKTKSNKNLYIAIPEIFNGLSQYTFEEKEFWAISTVQNYKNWFAYCDGIYYNAFISRPYLRYKNKKKCDLIFNKIKKIYKNRDIIIIEGEYSRLGVGNDLFDTAKSVKRILCPTKNAYSKYTEILREILKHDKQKLILVSLGPTSKPLVFDLYNRGYQALDMGHIDLEYEWFLKQETKKVKIKNKFVNEIDNGDETGALDDEKYNSQILININNKE